MRKYLTSLVVIFLLIGNYSKAQVLCIRCFNQDDSISHGVNNLMLNSSFENTDCSPYPSPDKYCPNSLGYNCNIANWTCTGGDVNTYACIFDTAIGTPVADGHYTAYFGNNFALACGPLTTEPDCLVDSACQTTGVPPGYPLSNPTYGDSIGVSLQQTVNGLTVGNVYVLEFWTNGESGFPIEGLFALDIGFGRIYLRNPSPISQPSSGRTYVVIFRATSTSHTVKFTNWGHICFTCTELVLDNVRMYTLAELSPSVAPCDNLFQVAVTHTNSGCGQCNGTAAATTINGILPVSYLWSNGATSANLTALCGGTYTVTATDAESHTAVASVTVTQPSPLTHTISSTATACGIDTGSATVTVTGGGGTYSYSWNTGDTTSSVNNLTAATYQVTVQSTTGCSFTDSVKVAAVNCGWSMPNAFSPNGDGKNDRYYPVISGDIKVVAFRIYNRWGALVHDNPTTGWDGTLDGKPQPAGTYMYYVKVELPDGNPADNTENGAVTLLR